MIKTYRSIFISDVHLGTRDCKAEELNNFFNKYGIEFKNIDEAMAQFIKVRNAAREQKNYKLSDELRDELNLIGIKLNDGKDNEWYWSNS